MPTWDEEYRFGYPYKQIIGVDEVGRGCLAGPVVAAAVWIPNNLTSEEWLLDVNDSKKLSPEKRLFLAEKIKNWAMAIGIGVCDANYIDRVNIFQASLVAMFLAIQDVRQKAQLNQSFIALIDGKHVPLEKQVEDTYVPLIKGDQRSYSISAASIVAKVYRDQLMEQFDLEYPHYGFAQHKGYPTKQHRAGIRKFGVCPLHRRSFQLLSAL
jgi:ribonuclease HII